MLGNLLNRPRLLLGVASIGVVVTVAAAVLLRLRAPVAPGPAWVFTLGAALSLVAIARVTKLITPPRSTPPDTSSRSTHGIDAPRT